MARFIFFILLIAALGLGAGWLAEQPGSLLLEWGGWQLEAPLALALGLAAFSAVALLFAWRLLRWIWRLPGWWGRRREGRRREQAYDAFTQGMIAVASGEAEAAARWSAKADKLFDAPALPRMLAAYAAEVSGNREEARARYTSMVGDADTEFLGLRGLLQEAMREHDMARALENSERALKVRPESVFIARTRLDLLARSGKWPEAEAALKAARKSRALSEAEADHRLAVIALAQATETTNNDVAYVYADRAVSLAADLVPAIAMLARLEHGKGKDRRAAKVLRSGWIRAPHPLLTDVFMELNAKTDAGKRLKLADELASLRPEHAESRYLLAWAAIKAGEYQRARAECDACPKPLTPRLAGLMADLEEAQYGDRDGAERWRTEARRADEIYGWTCRDCHGEARYDGTGLGGWAPHCGTCGAFASLDWVRREERSKGAVGVENHQRQLPGWQSEKS